MGDDYGYGNARIRGMKAMLLDGRAYETLLALTSIDALIEALAGTPYREEIEAALVKQSGAQCVAEGLRKNVSRSIGSMAQFFDGRPRELVQLLVARWDLYNLIAILRGQTRGIAAEEIFTALVPAGALKLGELRELAKQPTAQATVELMLAWGLPFGGALARSLRLSGGDPARGETELYRICFHEALADLGDEENEMLVREMFRAEIDVKNLSLLIRLLSLSDRRGALQARYGLTDPTALLLEGGHLTARRLAELGAATDAETVRRLLEATPYGPALRTAWEEYQRSRSEAVLERALERDLMLRGIRMFHRDPLSIGMAMGYLWAKSAEVANLRVLTQGKVLGWSPDTIRQELIWRVEA